MALVLLNKKTPGRTLRKRSSKTPKSRRCYVNRGLMSGLFNSSERCYRKSSKTAKRLKVPIPCNYPRAVCDKSNAVMQYRRSNKRRKSKK